MLDFMMSRYRNYTIVCVDFIFQLFVNDLNKYFLQIKIQVRK